MHEFLFLFKRGTLKKSDDSYLCHVTLKSTTLNCDESVHDLTACCPRGIEVLIDCDYKIQKKQTKSNVTVTKCSQHHHHLHFGNEILDQHSMDLTASSIDPWRWPFICIILALAVHAVFAQHIKKKTKVNHSHKEKQTEMHRTDLLVVDRHASKGWEG